jgi:hypothetical protein
VAMNDPLQSGMESQPFHMSAGPTGKGRGGGLADALKPHRSALMTRGRKGRCRTELVGCNQWVQSIPKR